MPALVPELVIMASNPSVPTDDLLRRALVVAKRLNVGELVSWIDAELNGYKIDQEVPDYRTVRGLLRAIDLFSGRSIPLEVNSAKLAHTLSTMPLRQSITELEHLAASPSGVKINYGHEWHQALTEHLEDDLSPYVSVSSAQLLAVISSARNRILDWGLDLEGRGILGESMSFTQQEKQAVQEQHYHFGNVSGSQIQISSNGSTQTQANTTGTDLEALRGLVEALGTALDRGTVQGDAADELRAELATLKAQAASPKPKWEIIKATARTIKTVAEGAAGNILGELAKPHVATLLALAAGAAGG